MATPIKVKIGDIVLAPVESKITDPKQQKKFDYKPGVVRFIGETKFSTGQWLGIEMNEPDGKYDGSVNGVRYFTCIKNHGLFCKPAAVKPYNQAIEESASPTAATSSIPKPAAAATTTKSIPKPTGIKSPAPSTTALKKPATTATALKAPSNIQPKRGSVVSKTTPAPAKSPDQKTVKPEVEAEAPAATSGVSETEEISDSGAMESGTADDSGTTEASDDNAPMPADSSASESVPPAQPVQPEKPVQPAQPAHHTPAPAPVSKPAPSKPASSTVSAGGADAKELEKWKQRCKELEASLDKTTQDLKKTQSSVSNFQLASLTQTTQIAQLNKTKAMLEDNMKLLETKYESSKLDYELAQEEAEQLRIQLQQQTQQFEQLTKEYQLFQEHSANTMDKLMAGLPADKQEQAKIVEQNKLLTRALVKIRDQSEADKKILQQQQQDLTTLHAQVEELKKYPDLLQKAQAQIQELQAHLDETKGYEEELQKLQDKNDQLEKNEKQLNDTITQFKVLLEAQEELEVEQKDIESQLQNELETVSADLLETKRELQQKKQQISDLNTTLRNFRTKVATLEAESQNRVEFEKNLLEQQNKRAIPELKNLETRLQQLSRQMRADAVMQYIDKLIAKQAQLRIQYIMGYIPPNIVFDEKGFSLMCVLNRIHFKAHIGRALLEQYYGTLAPVKISNAQDALELFAYRACLPLLQLSKGAQTLLLAVNMAPQQQFASAASSHGDITSVENAEDGFLHMVANDVIHEHTPIDTLHVAVKNEMTFLTTHFPDYNFQSAKGSTQDEMNNPIINGVIRLHIAYESQTIFCQQVSTRVHLQSLGDLLQKIANQLNSDNNATVSSPNPEDKDKKKEDTGLPMFQQMFNEIYTLHMNTHSLSQQIVQQTANDLLLGTRFDITSLKAPSLVSLETLDMCLQLSATCLQSASQILSTANHLTKLFEASNSSSSPLSAQSDFLNSNIGSSGSGNGSGGNVANQSSKFFDNLLDAEMKEGGMFKQLEKLHGVLLIVAKQSAQTAKLIASSSSSSSPSSASSSPSAVSSPTALSPSSPSQLLTPAKSSSYTSLQSAVSSSDQKDDSDDPVLSLLSLCLSNSFIELPEGSNPINPSRPSYVLNINYYTERDTPSSGDSIRGFSASSMNLSQSATINLAYSASASSLLGNTGPISTPVAPKFEPAWSIHASALRAQLQDAASVKSQIEERDRIIQAKTKEIFDSKKQLQSDQAIIVQLQTQIKNLQNKETINVDLRDELDKRDAKLKDLQSVIDVLQQDIDKEKKSKEDLRKKVIRYKMEIAKLTSGGQQIDPRLLDEASVRSAPSQANINVRPSTHPSSIILPMPSPTNANLPSPSSTQSSSSNIGSSSSPSISGSSSASNTSGTAGPGTSNEKLNALLGNFPSSSANSLSLPLITPSGLPALSPSSTGSSSSGGSSINLPKEGAGGSGGGSMGGPNLQLTPQLMMKRPSVGLARTTSHTSISQPSPNQQAVATQAQLVQLQYQIDLMTRTIRLLRLQLTQAKAKNIKLQLLNSLPPLPLLKKKGQSREKSEEGKGEKSSTQSSSTSQSSSTQKKTKNESEEKKAGGEIAGLKQEIGNLAKVALHFRASPLLVNISQKPIVLEEKKESEDEKTEEKEEKKEQKRADDNKEKEKKKEEDGLGIANRKQMQRIMQLSPAQQWAWRHNEAHKLQQQTQQIQQRLLSFLASPRSTAVQSLLVDFPHLAQAAGIGVSSVPSPFSSASSSTSSSTLSSSTSSSSASSRGSNTDELQKLKLVGRLILPEIPSLPILTVSPCNKIIVGKQQLVQLHTAFVN